MTMSVPGSQDQSERPQDGHPEHLDGDEESARSLCLADPVKWRKSPLFLRGLQEVSTTYKKLAVRIPIFRSSLVYSSTSAKVLDDPFRDEAFCCIPRCRCLHARWSRFCISSS